MTRKQGYFLTGDYARVDEDGYYWFLGRRDDLINSFGYQVSPVEVERILKSHPYVADCAVVGRRWKKIKVLITACVILHEEARISAEALIEFAAQHLAKIQASQENSLYGDISPNKNGKGIETSACFVAIISQIWGKSTEVVSLMLFLRVGQISAARREPWSIARFASSSAATSAPLIICTPDTFVRGTQFLQLISKGSVGSLPCRTMIWSTSRI